MTIDYGKLSALAEGLRDVRHRTSRRSWYDISNKSSDKTEIYIYDEIGEWGISAAEFVNDLRSVTSKQVDVHIHSGGGVVFEGVAIFTSLVQHPAEIHTYNDGLAASAASFIMQAGKKRYVTPKSRTMIHNAQGGVFGDEVDLEEGLRMVKDLSDLIAQTYAERSGQGDTVSWRKLMGQNGKAGTWFTAEEAVQNGLADEIVGASVSNSFTNKVIPVVTNIAAEDPSDLHSLFRVFQEV